MTPRIHIGPAGWSYPDWDGIVYPTPAGRAFDALEYIASYVDLIEINSTFYRVPSPRVCDDWAKRVAGKNDFTFTVKVHRDLTHGRAPAHESDAVSFTRAVAPLADRGKLGSLLIQFPWSFRMSSDARRYIRDLTRWLRPFPTAVEVRHGSWESPPARRFFRENDITLCGIDQPLVGDSLGPTTYEPGRTRAYFRFHGRNKDMWFKRDAGRDDRYNYLYSAAELSSWRERIESVPTGVERLFVVLNNHFRGQAVANALQLRAMLSGVKSDAPPELLDAYPQIEGSLRPVRSPRTRIPVQHKDTGQTELNLFDDKDEQDK
ncbi:MAG: DUF72 domain-containing protein [Candidatus Latescibacterota bacterium]|nr:MAG: DUF72 domain-containing protein [Candidatus Latescibacterota bacterium]